MRTSRHLAVAALLGASLVLAGCSNDTTPDGDGDASPESTSQAGTEEPTTEEATTEETPDFDVAAVDFGAAGTTEPGTTVPLGSPAWVVTSASPEGSSEPVDVNIGLSLLQVTEGSTDIWADWDNADEFAAFTPYLMVLQYAYPDGLPEGVDEPPAPAIFPLLEDGSGASFIEAQNFGLGSGASDECGYTLQGWDPETNTLVMCVVGLSDAGPITGGLFNGDSWSGFVQGLDAVYGDNPIIWE